MVSRSLSLAGLVVLLLAGLVPGVVRARPARVASAGRRVDAAAAVVRSDLAVEPAAAGAIMATAVALPGAGLPVLRPAAVAPYRAAMPAPGPAPARVRVAVSSRAPPAQG